MTRTEFAVKNIKFGIFSKLIYLLLNFISRTIFIYIYWEKNILVAVVPNILFLIDIYLHSTDEMKKDAADKINVRFSMGKATGENVQTDSEQAPQETKFDPKKGKMRKAGTGCISKINDHLYEGRYSPKDAYGKRMARNIYAKTEEECEIELAKLIVRTKAEIAAQKAELRMAQ